jgi:hypothetical protein
MMIIIRKEDRTYREAVWAYSRLVESITESISTHNRKGIKEGKDKK